MTHRDGNASISESRELVRRSPGKTFWHRHQWEILTVNQAHDHNTINIHAITFVLYGCACGKRRTKTLEGHWTIEQMRGEENEISRVLRQVEKATK